MGGTIGKVVTTRMSSSGSPIKALTILFIWNLKLNYLMTILTDNTDDVNNGLWHVSSLIANVT